MLQHFSTLNLVNSRLFVYRIEQQDLK
jgi:hypothetical protein